MPAPVAAATRCCGPGCSSAASSEQADLAVAKSKAQLLTWAANKLASGGSPEAPAMRARELRHWPPAAPATPVAAAAPVAVAPVAAAQLQHRSVALAPRFVARHGTGVEQINDFWLCGWESSGWQKIVTLLLFYNGA